MLFPDKSQITCSLQKPDEQDYKGQRAYKHADEYIPPEYGAVPVGIDGHNPVPAA